MIIIKQEKKTENKTNKQIVSVVDLLNLAKVEPNISTSDLVSDVELYETYKFHHNMPQIWSQRLQYKLTMNHSIVTILINLPGRLPKLDFE